MRIMILSMYFKPDAAATGQLMSELAEELADQGHDLAVITSMPHYSTNSIWPEYRGKFRQSERQGNIHIERVWSYVPVNKDKLGPRFLSYFSFSVLSFLVGLTMQRPDVILTISPSPPLTNGWTAYWLGKIMGAPLVTNVQDIYPDVAIRMGVMKNPAIIAFYKWLEKFVYKHSAAITVISHGFSKNLQKKGVPERKLAMIPNFIDANFVCPMPRKNSFSAEKGWHDKFVVLFAGNVGMSQGLDNVLLAAEKLKAHEDIQFLIVGNGASKPMLETMAEEMNLTNVEFMPYQDYNRVPEIHSAADVCLVPLKKGLTENSVPSKLWTIMGVARPVIASVDYDSDTAVVVRDSECGMWIEPENADAIANAIETLYNDRPRAERYGLQGRAYVQTHYTRVRVAQQYEEVFEKMVPRTVGNRVSKQAPTEPVA